MKNNLIRIMAITICMLFILVSPVSAASIFDKIDNSNTIGTRVPNLDFMNKIGDSTNSNNVTNNSIQFFSQTSITIGTRNINNSSKLILSMEKTNAKLLQGTVYFIPTTGGTSINMNFSNYSSASYTMDLSRLKPGTYTVKIMGSPVGTSSVLLSYRFI